MYPIMSINVDALCAIGWCESKDMQFWLVRVAFLYTDAVIDSSASLHRHTSRNGSFPSSDSFSTVNWLHALIDHDAIRCLLTCIASLSSNIMTKTKEGSEQVVEKC